MTYDRFEDTPVWQAAIELKLRLDELIRRPAFRPLRNWVDQINRAALSISSNVAEGFERGTTNQLLAFLYIARGSAGEVRSMLRYAVRRPDLRELSQELHGLIAAAESISRQLRGWAEFLQNSEIRGQRHLNDPTRRQHDQKPREQAFLTQIERGYQASLDKWQREMHEQRTNESEPRDPPESGGDD